MEILKNHIHSVCKIGQGSSCCRYLLFGKYFECGKTDDIAKASLDSKVDKMTAKADGCSGWSKEMLENNIINAEKTFVSYHSYPTGTVSASHIIETSDKESVMYKHIDEVLNIGVGKLGIRRDNKEAVQCMLEGFDKPVYFCAYDFNRIICYEINSKDDPSKQTIKIP